ncbi:hypothetical protein Tco_0873686 [Tanacetum coccineum]|uniref:Uncharacterized protein n=1 Tax=Tanacetum coccineum TaxID=301880 RepID=A0ABQ5BJI2_9ASTR
MDKQLMEGSLPLSIPTIMGYGDLHIGNILISQVYYIEGLGHNLFSVGQFCDSNPWKVVIQKTTPASHYLDGVDLTL